jgi:aspartokinase-like uncharacterized kinase
MSLDAVIKIGGSLGRGTGLKALCREVARLGQSHRFLIVPGGGEFADLVRESYKRYSLSDTTAHYMALLAMDQYGYLLNEMIEGSSLVEDLQSVGKVIETGRAAVLLPSSMARRTYTLPHSWQVTSDSVAAWVTWETECPRLVLLKDVDGLLDLNRKLIANMTVNELAGQAGGVDEYFARFLASAQLEVWIINGLRPERLSELLSANQTIGTRIEPSAV